MSARVRDKPRQPVRFGPWPPPMAAIQAWIDHQHTWTAVHGQLRYTGTGRLRPRPTDVRIRAALAGGPLGWTQLRDALVTRGMTRPAAAGAIHDTPIIRRDRPRGHYHLLTANSPS